MKQPGTIIIEYRRKSGVPADNNFRIVGNRQIESLSEQIQFVAQQKAKP